MIVDIACLAILLLAAFFIRWFPIRNLLPNFDTYFYMLTAEEVYKQKLGFTGSLKFRQLPPVEKDRPYLWQWLFGKIPSSILQKYQKEISAIQDSIFAVSLFYVSIACGLNYYGAFTVFLLYLFTPMWFSSKSMGPRVHSLTPRLFSEIVGNLFFIVLYAPIPITDGFRFIISTLLATTILLSTKFGIQVLFLLVPLISLFLLDLFGVYVLITAIIFTIIITKGKFIPALKRHFIGLKNYFIRNMKDQMPVSDRNSFRPIYEIVTSEIGIANKIKKLINPLLRKNSYTAVFFKMPVLIFAWTAMVYLFLMEETITNFYYIAVPVFSTTIIYLIVNIRIFLFIGEAERYLNHIAFFIVLLSVLGGQALGLNWINYLLIAYGSIYWCVEAFSWNRNKIRSEREKESQSVLSYLKKLPEKKKLALYPYHAVGVWRILLETRHSVLFPPNTDKEKFEEFKKYEDKYPFFKLEKFNQIVKDYGIEILIVKSKVDKFPADWKVPIGWKESSISGKYLRVFEKIQ